MVTSISNSTSLLHAVSIWGDLFISFENECFHAQCIENAAYLLGDCSIVGP